MTANDRSNRPGHSPTGWGIMCNPAPRCHLVVLLLWFGLGQALADDADEVRQRLADLAEQIQGIEAQIREDRGQIASIEDELRTLDQTVARQSDSLRSANAAIGEKENELATLESQRSQLRQSLTTQREALGALVRTAYASGRGERLRLLLSQDDPDRITRMLSYYEYLQDARGSQMEQLRGQLSELEAVQRRIRERLTELTDLRRRRADELAALERSRGQRRQVLVSLERAVAERDLEVSELESQREELEAVLKAIEEALADIPVNAGDVPFSSARGGLNWPVSGTVRYRFGQQRAGGQRWRGNLIAAESGADVKVIAGGRVVYSDWLRGHGLLLIVDHGEGYLSLYAHNQTLFADVGEWVSRGQTVAAVGASGGRTETGLYFELRKDGKAVDPKGWFASAVPGR